MATDIDSVRLLIADLGSSPVFTNAQVQTFLDVEAGNVKRAAAQALDTLASNEALVSKVIKDRNLSTDGAKVADALRKHAATLRGQADVDADDEFAFEIVEFDPYIEYPGFQVF